MREQLPCYLNGTLNLLKKRKIRKINKNVIWISTRLNYLCALSERNLETATHLFIECPFACEVWCLVPSWSKCANLHPNNWAASEEVEDWFVAMTNSGTKRHIQLPS